MRWTNRSAREFRSSSSTVVWIEGPEIVSYVATDNYKGGKMAAEQMAKAIGEKGNVILLRYLAGSESTEQREEGFLDGLKEYPDIKVVSSDQRGGDNATASKEKVDQLLQLYGEDLAGSLPFANRMPMEPSRHCAMQA